MSNPYAHHQPGLESPPIGGFDITPHDTNELGIVTRCISSATSGNVKVTYVNGTTATIYLVAGVQRSGQFKIIWSTGTTATGIVGEY